MKKVIFPLFILFLGGAVGGCAGQGYGGAAYGGSYATYHASSAYYYGYPYPSYYYPGIRSIHPPTVIIRPPLRPDRRMIIDRRYPDRFLRDDHRRFQRDHRWERGGERFVHPRYGKDMQRLPDHDRPSERRFSRDRDLHPRDRQFHRFDRGPGFRPGGPRCTGARC